VESHAANPLPPNAKHQIDLARCQATIAQDPCNASAWLEQAEVYYDFDDLSRALAAVNKAWDLGARGRQATSVKACVIAEYALAHGSPKAMLREAMQLFESLRTNAPASAQVDYNVGNCLAGLAEHQAAVDHFDVALKKKPKPALAAQIWKNRGTCFFHLGQHDEEARSYQRALELDPGLWEAYASWAATELRLGEYLHAKELLERCLQVNPDLEINGVPQVYSLAYALWRLGEEEEAYKRASQVLKLNPLHQDARLLAAHLLSDLWRSNPAYIPDATAFFQARMLDEPEALFERGELYLLYRCLGRQEVAQKIIEETISAVDVPPQTLYHYAMLLEDEGKIGGAIYYLEKAFSKSQAHHIVHSLARLNKRTGDYRRAIEFYQLALYDVQERLAILHEMGDCYHFLGEHKQCVRLCAESILIDPREEASWANLAYALARLGKETLFWPFDRYLKLLQAKADVSDDYVEAVVAELLSRMRVDFGEEFVEIVVAGHIENTLGPQTPQAS
jgi:tetratricopeptide (TPR) repeat protein